MNRHQSCYSEERMVDLLLNESSEEKELAFREHCAHCPTCQALADEWRERLAGYSNAQASRGGHTSYSVTLEADDWSQAKASVRRNLWSKLKRTSLQRRFAWFNLKPMVALSMLAILLSLATLVKLTSFPADTEQAVPSPTDNPPLVLINQPTVGKGLGHGEAFYYYTLRSTVDPSLDGFISINPATAEVYIYVQGIPTVLDRDYQAWLMEERSPIDMGLLRLENGAGQLYRQSVEVNRASMFRISIEPKGGSVYPTGPDFLLIQLDQ